MARLFGLIGNRADLAGRVLASEKDALTVTSRPNPERTPATLGPGERCRGANASQDPPHAKDESGRRWLGMPRTAQKTRQHL